MNIKQKKILIVGAGLYGSVIARELAEKFNKDVTIIDKRSHIAGNCFDQNDEQTGIKYHLYGAHIFHTSNEDIWTYVNKYSQFNTFNHTVYAYYKEKTYQLPFNLETINKFYDINLKPFEVNSFLDKERSKEFYPTPQNMEEQAISILGRPMYEAFIRNYTIKQWAKDPKDLPSEIIKRLPVRNNYKKEYFNDKYIAMPKFGYTEFFKNLLNHPRITILLNQNFNDMKNTIDNDTFIVYTGSIDEYFDYNLGHLEYRTVDFQYEIKDYPDYQGTVVINYPEMEFPYTRICEPKYFYPENWNQYSQNQTLIIKEFSKLDDGNAPYYPINDTKNLTLFDKYCNQSKKLENIHFGGRLGAYKYLDMHQVIANALDFINRLD